MSVAAETAPPPARSLRPAALLVIAGLLAAFVIAAMIALTVGAAGIPLARLPAARATNMLYAVPPVATLIGWLWLNEVPTTLGLIGGALALGGVVLVNVKK